jgi:hypothetical protein
MVCMSRVDEVVTVVIPAYNAESTIDDTLRSARSQTYRALDIVVVDDGSRDATAELADRHTRADGRVRVVSIANSGVAHARNVGIAIGGGAFVAPLDADDVWHPAKIERQMESMRALGPDTGLIYTYYRRIDPKGRVIESGDAQRFEGHVFLRSLYVNFVGNGSALLLRRAALNEVGGYEPDLRRRSAGGFEDYLIQVLIARHWRVGVVPEYLTGYRSTPGAMSEARVRMARSNLAMLEHVAESYPETPAADLAMAQAAAWARLAVRLFANGHPRQGAAALQRGLRLAPVPAIRVAASQMATIGRRNAQRLLGKGGCGPDFLELAPTADASPARRHPLERRLAHLETLEEDFARSHPRQRPARAVQGLRTAKPDECAS